jgi:hypothetical protein
MIIFKFSLKALSEWYLPNPLNTQVLQFILTVSKTADITRPPQVAEDFINLQ